MAYYGQQNPQQNQQFLWGIFQKLVAITMQHRSFFVYSNIFALQVFLRFGLCRVDKDRSGAISAQELQEALKNGREFICNKC